MRAIGLKVNDMDLEYINIKMELFIQETGLMTKRMGKEFRPYQMDKFMKENG